MGRRQNDQQLSHFRTPILLFVSFISCALVYIGISVILNPQTTSTSSSSRFHSSASILEADSGSECCRGIDNLELWGPAVKWGTDFKLNSSEECCKACKAMCTGDDGPCLCDTWVFCGNREACGLQFRQVAVSTPLTTTDSPGKCWLKKQKDTLAPERQDTREPVHWTSGIIFGKGEGIVGLETEHGTLHIKLFPDFAPHSVAYILDLLSLRHCAGCQFYRAEGRGNSWDEEGNHIENAPFGPPFGLIQGTMEAGGLTFKRIPSEVSQTVTRGSIAWVGSGPEFFISLADHQEWKKTYTVFGSVLSEDMEIAERIAELPSKPDVWNHINVSVLEKPVPLLVRRIKTSQGDLQSA